MPLTPEQVLERRGFVGSSDASAIMGLDPYKTAHDVWWSKVGPVPTFLELEAEEIRKPWLKWGNALEEPVMDWAEGQIDAVIARGTVVQSDRFPMLKANLDGEILEPENGHKIVEAKTCGILGPSPEWKFYGESGTDEVPRHVLIQVAHQFACVGPAAQIAYVPALLSGRGFLLYVLRRDEELVETVAGVCAAWWERYVLMKERPPGTPPIGIMKQFERVEGKKAVLADGTIRAWREAKDRVKNAKADVEVAETVILEALQDAEFGESKTAGGCSYKMQKRKAYSVDAAEYRVLRYQKP